MCIGVGLILGSHRWTLIVLSTVVIFFGVITMPRWLVIILSIVAIIFGVITIPG